MEYKDLPILLYQIYGCLYTGNIRGQAICSHGINFAGNIPA